MKKILGLFLIALVSLILVGCVDNSQPVTFTVDFDTGEGGTPIASEQIRNGGKVLKPTPDPTRDGYHFTGDWYYGNSVWDFDLDIVTGNMTLVAEWTEVTSTPTNIKMSDDAFSSTVVWNQSETDIDTVSVEIKLENGSYTKLSGTAAIINEGVVDTVSFVPSNIPSGGYYTVKITSNSVEGISGETLLFAGAGTSANPYRSSKVLDITTILDNDAYANKHYLQVADISSTLNNPIEIGATRKISFSGTYDGGNKSILFTGDGALFHKITATGIVKNLTVLEGTTISSAETDNYPVGVIADENNGIIENITSRAQVTDSRLQGALVAFTGNVDIVDQTTGAGGIVGVNKATGTIKKVTISGAGAIKAGRGIGGVAAWNHGLIEEASVSATLPAGNQANSGKTANSYSYGGGIAGFNLGTINKCVVSGRVFAQSAYAAAGDGNELVQVGFGGIAGYNGGTISESSFARSMSAKEFIDKSRATELNDAANNLGVASIHGDSYIGGLSGINAGTIIDSYVGGALIGGRDFVGGIAGLTIGTGSISNTYVFAEIAIKDDGGNKITTANSKTSVTTYAIAPNGFDANTTFAKVLINSESSQTWLPGDVDAPKLPEFNAADLAKVGAKFASSGVLLWQQGTVTGVNIILESTVLAHGETVFLEYTISPSNAPDLFTTWTSSDETVVEIVGDGEIKGVGPGTATVTVTTRDGGYTDTITVTVEDYNKITSITVSATANGETFELPTVNDANARPKIEVGTIITLSVSILPEDADYKGYKISSSNTRGEANGNEFSFVLGSGYGSVSIYIDFDDSSVERYNYRFETVAKTIVDDEKPVISATVGGSNYQLPEANNSTNRLDVVQGTVIVFNVLMPEASTNKNYTISILNNNTRASVDGNTVTVAVNTDNTGSFSVIITFEDTAYAELNYRFSSVVPAAAVISATVGGSNYQLPEANNSTDRLNVDQGTVIVFSVVIPEEVVNKNYTISILNNNSRATVDGNTVTVVVNATNGGSFSVIVSFESSDLEEINYRFTSVAAK